MKRLNLLLLSALILMAGSLASCLDDNSTMANTKIDGVEIDTTGMGTLSVLQFTELTVKPTLHTDLKESDLSYEWKLSLGINSLNYQILSRDRNLVASINRKANPGGDPYQLVYTVTDKSTGLKYIMGWPLNVKNSLGEGLVVANSNGGGNTDLGLILSPQVTPDYSEVKIFTNAYSSVNNDLLNGTVKDIQYTNILGTQSLLTITDNTIVRINRQDFTYNSQNNDLFYAHGATFSPEALYKLQQGTIYVGEGQLTGTYLGASKKFASPTDYDATVPPSVAVNAKLYVAIAINFYDASHGRFVYLPTIQSFGDNAMHAVPASTSGPFNPAALNGKENMAAVAATDGKFRHLLRDKSNGDFTLYVLSGGVSAYPSPDPPKPVAKYDFSNAPEIQNATHFVLPDNQKVMYYATDTKIYAAIYGSSSPVYEERYSAPAGESITTLQLYHQTGYPYRSSLLDTDGRQLIMSTYDGSEGKVYLLPIVNLGAGNIDEANIKTFDGFGKVSAIAPQQ